MTKQKTNKLRRALTCSALAVVMALSALGATIASRLGASAYYGYVPGWVAPQGNVNENPFEVSVLPNGNIFVKYLNESSIVPSGDVSIGLKGTFDQHDSESGILLGRVYNYEAYASNFYTFGTSGTTVYVNLLDMGHASFVRIVADESYLIVLSYRTAGNIWYHDYATFVYHVPVPVPLPPDPTKPGHTFVGWYYDAAFTQPYDNAPIYDTIELFAKFEINHYNVYFDMNGVGAEVFPPVTLNWGTNYTPPTPTRDGYVFDGWKLNGQPYAGGTIIGDITLTATWHKIICTVTFYDGNTVYATLYVPYGGRLSDAVQSLNISLMSNKILSAESGAKVGGSARVLDDMSLNVVEASNWESLMAFFEYYWHFFLFALAAVFVLLLGASLIIKRVKGD